MGKYLTILAVGALALTACTSEDVLEDVAKTRNLITFENAVSKNSRAVEDLNASTLTQFNVFGFYTMPGHATVANEVFDDVVVSKTQTGWSVKTEDERYWIKDAKYYFYAYSCGALSLDTEKFGDFDLDMTNEEGEDGVIGMPASERVLKIKGYLCDWSHQHDLVFASNTGAVDGDQYAGITGLEAGNMPVAFQFKHILTKIGARFTSRFPAEYEVRIKNVTVDNIRNQGDYSPVDGWTNVIRPQGIPFVNLLDNNTTNPQIISVTNGLDAKGNQLYVDTDGAYVIPTAKDNETSTLENKTVSINFEIELYVGSDFVMTKKLSGTFTPDWKEGYKYLYNIELSGSTTNMQAIAFTTATDAEGNVISNWGEEPVILVEVDKN
ncbi:MAG: fimbrillin family protein [Muribaculaceae bacterium]|nr:fimbrillin family protein [Muribaculaceae bacterium]